MQHLVKFGLMVTLMLASLAANAAAANYVGIDYNITRMQGRDRFNYAMNAALPDIYHGYEIYAAHRFDNDVGLSISWLQTKFSSKYHNFNNNEAFLVDTMRAGDHSSIQARIEAIHFDLTGYLDITDQFEAVGQMGFALTRVTMHASVFANGVNTNMMPTNNFDNVVPRVSFGLQYFLPVQIGLRAMVSWIGSDYMHMSFTDEDGVRTSIKPFRESWMFSIGIVGKFL